MRLMASTGLTTPQEGRAAPCHVGYVGRQAVLAWAFAMQWNAEKKKKKVEIGLLCKLPGCSLLGSWTEATLRAQPLISDLLPLPSSTHPSLSSCFRMLGLPTVFYFAALFFFFPPAYRFCPFSQSLCFFAWTRLFRGARQNSQFPQKSQIRKFETNCNFANTLHELELTFIRVVLLVVVGLLTRFVLDTYEVTTALRSKNSQMMNVGRWWFGCAQMLICNTLHVMEPQAVWVQ